MSATRMSKTQAARQVTVAAHLIYEAGDAGYRIDCADDTYVHVQAVDGEISCGIEIFHLTNNGVTLGEFRLLGGPSIRPVVEATLEALLTAAAFTGFDFRSAR